MIALLTGKIAYKSLDHVIVDVGGVGYRVTVPLSTFYQLPDEGPVQLQIHTNVKEDAISLYGFLTTAEKEMFALLLSVSGVGPKLAVNILSNIPAADLRSALGQGDIRRLSAVPGIGKKTAERLTLELKDKVEKLAAWPTAGHSAPPAQSDTSGFEDALSALVNLGYKDTQARKVLESLEFAPSAGLEEILKGALKVLMK
ncbi:Holliday junction branch migration protein RuvA [Geoalkalibacter halelectricus]|uniref:Holliday junction branch migration complex subunit RuvA n=1 Tax=Geoalkalibacter halelectricus TaxID=2847045 RepID=A0ABY5ZR29_9BACT|nr:Holliday junction branch migration protein RuvA [Geoalkalibacter halelectricus]MDO3379211.1 Holliday junction branch migration protein RuvA [Geoalkalibacter halelectricus]UWZ80969.1 Holliday junction branch migration protein RuvA [Geoalkalibacter halelectricus]